MWFGDVEIPEAVIDAHRLGTLVLFVGAGASISPPSSIPGFVDLTKVMASESGEMFTSDELRDPSRVLGVLQGRNVDVHVRVARLLRPQGSTPNRIHSALARIAVSSKVVRVVTTNYDDHLSTELVRLGADMDTYYAPALPVGNEFTGIVYVHGCVAREAQTLIVTDADFGRAYLTDAWAARFLERMFSKFTVLFVGYSHNDIVLTYLGRALGLAAARYMLTDRPTDSLWRQLDIHPIGYPNAADNHEALRIALERWAERVEMGLLDHRQLIAGLLSVPPSQIPEERSYLESAISSSDTVGFFAEYARGDEWLGWAITQPVFQQLFVRNTKPSTSAEVLSWWFVENFVLIESATESAMLAMIELGGRIGPTLWAAIGQRLHSLQEPRGTWLNRWLVVLLENEPEFPNDWLELALVASRWSGDRSIAILLFDHLTQPHATQRRSFGSRPSRAEIQIRGSAYWLTEAWQKLFVPNVLDAARDLIVIADRNLRRAFHLLFTGEPTSSQWDPVSLARAAIEQHGQNRTRDAANVLIDAARDSLDALLHQDLAVGLGYLRAWGESDVPILRRLSVHGWTGRTDISSDTKVAWIGEQGKVWDFPTHHETFQLLATALPNASSEVVDALVEVVVAGPEDASEEAWAQIFSLLAWIRRHAPHSPRAQLEFARIQEQHPGVVEGDHPDFLFWHEGGAYGSTPAMQPEQLHDGLLAGAASILRDLTSWRTNISPFSSQTWQDALALIADTVREWPLDGEVILDEADDDVRPSVTSAVILGWASADLNDEQIEHVLRRLALLDLSEFSDDIARLLHGGHKPEGTPTPWHQYPHARDLASRLWQVLSKPGPGGGSEVDWLAAAINHPAGRLAQFWVKAIAFDWAEAGDAWSQIAPEMRHDLEAMLATGDSRSDMAEVIFAADLRFFFGADPTWCNETVLPLLDWQRDPVRAHRAWSGFLQWGRWHDRLLEAGLLDLYLQAAENHEQFDELQRGRLAEHLAGVALFSAINPVASGWARTFTRKAGVRLRVEWMNHVDWLMYKSPPGTGDKQWASWMDEYWRDRIESVPIVLTFAESSAMAAWISQLDATIDEALVVLRRSPAGLEQHSSVLHRMTENRLAAAHPAAAASYVEYLLAGTSQPFYDWPDLHQIVQVLKTQHPPIDVNPIIENAVRLGSADAPNW